MTQKAPVFFRICEARRRRRGRRKKNTNSRNSTLCALIYTNSRFIENKLQKQGGQDFFSSQNFSMLLTSSFLVLLRLLLLSCKKKRKKKSFEFALELVYISLRIFQLYLNLRPHICIYYYIPARNLISFHSRKKKISQYLGIKKKYALISREKKIKHTYTENSGSSYGVI